MWGCGSWCMCAFVKQIQCSPKETESTQEPDNSELFLQLFLRQICVTAQEFCDTQHSRCLCKEHACKAASRTVVYTQWQWELDKLTKLHLSKSRIHMKLKRVRWKWTHYSPTSPQTSIKLWTANMLHHLSTTVLDQWQLTYKINTYFFSRVFQGYN